jgi:outer membrane immunogenic protein
MRRILLAGVAFYALIMPAVAADMAPYDRVPPPPVWGWTGFYIGANVGWAGSTDAVTVTGTDTGLGGLGTLLAIGSIPGIVNLNQTGFMGGGQIGYNWQVWPNWVVGIEADFQGVSAKASNAFTSLAPTVSTTYTRELDSLGTLRAKFGYLWFPSLLFYGTGGLAYGQNKIGTTAACPALAPPCESESSTANQISNTSAGWTIGGGAEWRFAAAWSVRAEYLYVDFGRHSETITYTYPGNTSTLTSAVREHDNIVRFGVNYMFGY